MSTQSLGEGWAMWALDPGAGEATRNGPDTPDQQRALGK